MKQLSFLEYCTEPSQAKETVERSWRLCIDGASRNNPGPAGIGIYLLNNEQQAVYQEGFFLGKKTNNEAEYLALIVGLFVAVPLMQKNDLLYVISDSQLLIRQLLGAYKVRQAHIRLLYDAASQLLASINYSLCHVMREHNVHADALANRGIDLKKEVPTQFVAHLKKFGIIL